MKKIFKTLFILSVVFGCSENKSDEIKLTNKKDNENQSFESIVNRHVQSQLSIPATEKFKIQIYKEHMDGDNKIDAIISVNRLDFAKEEAQKAGIDISKCTSTGGLKEAYMKLLATVGVTSA